MRRLALFLLLASCKNEDMPNHPVPDPSFDLLERMHVPGFRTDRDTRVWILHDDRRGVTCYTTTFDAISCVPDSLLKELR